MTARLPETTRTRRAAARPLAVGALCAAALAAPATACARTAAAAPSSPGSGGTGAAAAQAAAPAPPAPAPPAPAPPSPAATSAAASPLPAPTGSAPVGRRTLQLTDRARRDPFAKGRRPRELAVTLWYPAARAGGRAAPYAPPALARLLAANGLGRIGQARTHAREDAPMAPGSRPLLLFSPGFGLSRLIFQQLGEELASRGYVVAAVDHTYEAPLVVFPDGRAIGATLTEQDADRPVVLATRVADVRFALRSLLRTLHGRVDPGRIGVFGHSFGGATAANVMLREPSVRAGADLDGSLYGPAATRGLGRPFLLLTAGDGFERDRSLRTFHATLRGPRPVVDLPAAGHLSFGDAALLASAQLPAATRAEAFGTIDPARAVELQRRLLTAFFDRHLRRSARPLPHFADAERQD
jgi:predicted dienelactone hydrolase